MSDKTIHRVVCSSILEQDGKFAVLLHWEDGTPIIQSKYIFRIRQKAEQAGTEILDRSIAALRAAGFNVRRP